MKELPLPLVVSFSFIFNVRVNPDNEAVSKVVLSSSSLRHDDPRFEK
jgi:hypothetical protein